MINRSKEFGVDLDLDGRGEGGVKIFLLVQQALGGFQFYQRWAEKVAIHRTLSELSNVV